MAPGEYNATILVDIANVTIQSSGGPEVTTVHGLSVVGFLVAEPGVTIDGFNITACSYGIMLMGPFSADNCTIKNNIIENNGDGIWVETSNNTISNNTIRHNVIAPSGIHLTENSSNNLIINNLIEDNGHGIWIEGDDNKILGNDIFNNDVAPTSGIHLTLTATGNEIHLNNIDGNGRFGIYNDNTAMNVSADNNWWGNVSEPGGVGPGTGDMVSPNVTYAPWLGAPLELPAAHYEHLLAGSHVVDASSEADTRVTLTVTADRSETDIIIAKYQSQPFPAEPFPDAALGKYVDILVTNPGAVVWPIYVEVSYTDDEVTTAGIDESTLVLYYYNATANAFVPCSDTGVDTTNNIIWANVTAAEAGYLGGTPFGAGGQLPAAPPAPPPISAVPTLSQWGMIAMAILLAVALAGTVRRRLAADKGAR